MVPWGSLRLLGLGLCGWFMLFGQALAAQNVFDVTRVQGEAVSLTHYFDILEDPGATLTLADVSQPGFADRFKTRPASGQALGFSFTRSAIWLRLHLKNPSDHPVENVLEITYALLARVDFYQPSGQSYQSIEAGYLRPYPAQALPSRFIALPVSLPAGADQILYLRMQSPNSLNIPARLWTTEAFHAHEPADYVIQALYFGIVLALVLYNLMLFIALRDINYLLFVIVSSSAALGLATFTGMGSTFVWGFSPFWTKIGVNVPTALATVVVLALARRLLATRQLVPRLDPWFKGFMVANATFFLLLPVWFQEINPTFIVLSLLTALLIFATGVICAIKRQRSAYYFIAAFSVLLLANVLTHLRNLGLAPTNFLTNDGLQLGSVVEMLLLSLALADRFNVLRLEKIAVQNEALHVQGELVAKLQESEQLLETRVLQRTAELQRSLTTVRLRDQALNQISHGVMLANADRLLTDINDAAEQITGYTRHELLGRSCSLLHGPDTDPQTVQRIREALRTAQPFYGDILNYRKDGTPFWNELSIVPVFDNTGALNQFVGVQRDISQRKAAQAELILAHDAAQAANLAKSRFLATMSHEIRTPMNGILGMAQVLLQANIPESDRVDYARTIYRSGQTLLTLLNDILDLAKIEAGKVDLEFIPMEPLAILREVQALFAEPAKLRSLQIEVNWSGPERRYLGDSHRLRQMLSNLVGNALKFSQQGLIKIEALEIESAQQTAMLEFSVTDNGIGISKEQQALLFETFSQADSSTTRHYGGTGLGLSIVRTLAQAMGGEVGVHSETGQGARFWFRIQAERLDAAPGTAGAGVDIGTVAVAALSALVGRVLVVEDNALNQQVIGLVLGQLGVDVIYADDGQQGLALIVAGEPVDLILMDLAMPILDGYGATQQIRQWETGNTCARHPIIALTADAFDEDRQRCLDAGMDDFLTKPVLLPALHRVLAKWLPQAPAQVPARISSSAPVPTANKIEHIAALVQEILPLLEHNQYEGIVLFKTLQEAVAQTPWEAEITQAGLPLLEYRFDLTLERLRRLAIK